MDESDVKVPQLGMNRAMRRKASAVSHSVRWKQIVRSSERAAIRKLNKLSAKRRAEIDMYGDPLD